GRQPREALTLFIMVLERSLPERSITTTVVQNATLPLAPMLQSTNLNIPGVPLSLHPRYILESLRDSMHRIFGLYQ
ncbi:MAG: hypothetical protein NC130_06950, partial [Lachnoclostridium sp.]|nr:hypothetical protein [Lachnoclostridium sp.]